MTLLLALLACSETTDPAFDRLESLSATAGEGDEYEEVRIEGAAGVTGADRDWSIALTTAEGDVETVALHVPGASALSELDGDELSVELGFVWGDNPRPVSIVDADGAVFLAQQSVGAGPASDLYGADFARFGADGVEGEVASEYGDFGVIHHPVVFQADDGEVSASNGQPVEFVVDGVRWRVVVHAAFEVTETPDALPGCGGGVSTTLSFEMLRLETEPDLAPLTAATGAALAGEYGCG